MQKDVFAVCILLDLAPKNILSTLFSLFYASFVIGKRVNASSFWYSIVFYGKYIGNSTLEKVVSDASYTPVEKANRAPTNKIIHTLYTTSDNINIE